MSVRARLKDPTIRMRVGLSFLILASLSRWLPRLGAKLPTDALDAASGLLYGVAIGCMLLSLASRRRRD